MNSRRSQKIIINPSHIEKDYLSLLGAFFRENHSIHTFNENQKYAFLFKGEAYLLTFTHPLIMLNAGLFGHSYGVYEKIGNIGSGIWMKQIKEFNVPPLGELNYRPMSEAEKKVIIPYPCARQSKLTLSEAIKWMQKNTPPSACSEPMKSPALKVRR